jgi:hypothetical protein
MAAVAGRIFLQIILMVLFRRIKWLVSGDFRGQRIRPFCRTVNFIFFPERLSVLLFILKENYRAVLHGPVKFKKAVTPDELRQANYEL